MKKQVEGMISRILWCRARRSPKQVEQPLVLHVHGEVSGATAVLDLTEHVEQLLLLLLPSRHQARCGLCCGVAEKARCL
jgi:hypothetical protein